MDGLGSAVQDSCVPGLAYENQTPLLCHCCCRQVQTLQATIASERLYCSKGITILPYMMAGNTRTAAFLTPAVFRLVDSSKAGLILKHQPYVLILVGFFQFLDRRVNFFEDSMSSLLAFLGCLLRGMILRHPCRCSTQYICPFPTGWSTAS